MHVTKAKRRRLERRKLSLNRQDHSVFAIWARYPCQLQYLLRRSHEVKKTANEGIYNRSSHQLISSSKKRPADDEPNHSTEHLQLKTKDQLLFLCKSLNVSIPRGANNKATIIELITNDDMPSSRVKVVAPRANQSLGSISVKSTAQDTTAISPRYHDTTR